MRLDVAGTTKVLSGGKEVRESLDLVFEDSTLFLAGDVPTMAKALGLHAHSTHSAALQRVLTLCTAFESFRTSMLATTRLDPVHEASLPGATYQAAGLHTRERIDCITVGQEQAFEAFSAARRGGISYIAPTTISRCSC
jgi:hypothetical protein